MIKINNTISIKRNEVKFRMIKSSGPGGQNINKNSTAIKLEFDIKNSTSLPQEVKNLILNNKNKYLTRSGKIIISANRNKSQYRNKSEAINRLIRYLNNVTKTKKKRIFTNPTKSSIEKRLRQKKRNSIKKILRKNNDNEIY